MTDDEFDSLLEDSGVPWAYFSGGEGKRYVTVSALLSLARERGLSVEEPELDQHVARRGGSKKTEVWDLADVPRNLLRTLVRRPRKHGPSGYIIP
jgi:hypothetical protein